MTREEFEKALDGLSGAEHEGAGSRAQGHYDALLAAFDEQREEIARLRLGQSTAPWGIARVAALKAEIERLREMRDRLGHRAMELTRRVDQLSNAATDLNEAVDEWVSDAKAKEAKP